MPRCGTGWVGRCHAAGLLGLACGVGTRNYVQITPSAIAGSAVHLSARADLPLVRTEAGLMIQVPNALNPRRLRVRTAVPAAAVLAIAVGSLSASAGTMSGDQGTANKTLSGSGDTWDLSNASFTQSGYSGGDIPIRMT